MGEVKKELGSMKQDTKLSAPDTQKQNSYSSEFQKAFTEAVNPIVTKLDQIASKQGASDNNPAQAIQNAITALTKLTSSLDNCTGYISSTRDALLSFANSLGKTGQTSSVTASNAARDYTGKLNSILNELQSISSGGQARLTAINAIATAISGVEMAVKAQQPAATIDTNSIAQAITAGINPFLNKLDAQTASYVASTGELSRNIVGLDGYIDGLRKSTETNTNALSSLQNSLGNTLGAGSSESFSATLSPLVNSVQSLATTVASIQSINQGNEAEIAVLTSTVKGIESAIKGLEGGNTYNIDIKQ